MYTTKKSFELKNAKWYSSEKEQKKGLGADYYKVGSTVGLGGIRRWDGKKVVLLAPDSNRIATVKRKPIILKWKCYPRMYPIKEKR